MHAVDNGGKSDYIVHVNKKMDSYTDFKILFIL
jgi:hypothetical protein